MPAENRPLFRGDHLMAIGNAVQRGAFIFIYDEKGFKTATVPAGTGGEDGLKGYTSSTVDVRRGAFVYSHEEADQTISTCRFEIRPRRQAPLHIAKLTRRAIALTAKAVRLRHFREGSLPPGLMLARRFRNLRVRSPSCPSAWQPNPGRRSTYRRGKAVQTTGPTSHGLIDGSVTDRNRSS